MEPFTTVTGVAAPLLRADVDTDQIIPSREMTQPGREGYGQRLFAPWRYRGDADPATGVRPENPDFVLNQAPYRQAVILLAGPNFGCGSSRETAAWAVRQFGFRCVIAPSFGAIFRNNALRNGILPVVLPLEVVKGLADGGVLTVDLTAQTVTTASGQAHRFDIDPSERTMLLEGLDDIGLTLRHRAAIEAFQQADRSVRPWIWPGG